MIPSIDQFLASFDQLPLPEQELAAVEIWKRLKTREKALETSDAVEIWEGEIPKLTDEEFCEIADDIALMYEREEQSNGEGRAAAW